MSSPQPAAFEGFADSDFDVFALEGLEERLTAVRTRLRPQLLALGAAVAPGLSAAAGAVLFPHAAQHARRTANPPDDTWAALAPSPRGYQRHAHFAIGLERQGAYIRLVLKPVSDDKKTVSAAIARHGRDLLAGLPADCEWYDADHPTRATAVPALTEAELMLVAARLDQRKTSSLAVGFAVPRLEAAGSAFAKLALARCLDLLPLYQALTGANERHL